MDSKSKSNAISDEIRVDGNKSFAICDYFKALSNYNEALRFAEPNSKQLGLCCGNRSAAFLKVKQYMACLENIELARKNQFPKELLPKLRDREIGCKKLIEESETPMEETWHEFFKMFTLACNYAYGDVVLFKGIRDTSLSTISQDLGKYFISYFADAVEPCVNKLRYSCAPNMVLHAYNGKIVWIIHYPIKANDFLTVAFNNTMFFEKTLLERLSDDVVGIFAKCKCAACMGKWDRIIALAEIPPYIIRYTSEEAIVKLNEYCKEINDNAKPLGKKCDNNWFNVSRLRWSILNIGSVSF